MKQKNVYTPEESPNIVGNIAIIFSSVLLILFGVVMLLTDAVKIIYFCYGAGACLLIWGIWLISRYFLRNEFRMTTNYGFSIGTLLVILGAVALIRSDEIALTIPNYLGMAVLVEGVVMLQNTVQLKNLHGSMWSISLIFSILSVAAAIGILLDPGHIISGHGDVIYMILVLTGIFALLSLCFVGYRTKRFHMEEKRELQRQLDESREWFEEPQHTVKTKESENKELLAGERDDEKAAETRGVEIQEENPEAVLEKEAESSETETANDVSEEV